MTRGSIPPTGVSAEASDARERLCGFEFVSWRGGTVSRGKLLYGPGLRMGRRLAIELPPRLTWDPGAGLRRADAIG